MSFENVVVLAGPTGPTGLYRSVNIYANVTGASGQYGHCTQLAGPTGPTGTFEQVINVGATFRAGLKTIIIAGFTGNTPPVVGSAFNPADKASGITLSNANKTATGGSGNNKVRGTASKSAGKLYLEFFNIDFQGAGSGLIGTDDGVDDLTSGGSSAMLGVGPAGNLAPSGDMGSAPDGKVVGIAIDFTAKKYWLRYDAGLWNNDASANPATNVNGVDYNGLRTPPFFPAVWMQNAGVATLRTAGFTQAVPSGFTGWG